jgi:transglutaminase-like putative cysteine protease
MPFLTIRHTTVYRYTRPVAFGEHRMMMRPREGFDQRLIAAELAIDPAPAGLRWLHDVFGNTVTVARFAGLSDRLTVASLVQLEHLPQPPDALWIQDYARTYPFTYAPEDMPDLLRSIERQHPDPERKVDSWARRFVRTDGPTDTLAMIGAMTRAIREEFAYLPRHEKGTQTPVETLHLRQGTCRDYAVLMIEAARALGLAARFVSGYVYAPSDQAGVVGGGNTHAWVRIFLPGSGWTEFDPTNAILGNRGLVRVGVARDPYQVVPLSGTWMGFPGSFESMDVTVAIAMDGPTPHNVFAAATDLPAPGASLPFAV